MKKYDMSRYFFNTMKAITCGIMEDTGIFALLKKRVNYSMSFSEVQ